MKQLAHGLLALASTGAYRCLLATWFGIVAYESWVRSDALWVVQLPWETWHLSFMQAWIPSSQQGPYFLIALACVLALVASLAVILRPLVEGSPPDEKHRDVGGDGLASISRRVYAHSPTAANAGPRAHQPTAPLDAPKTHSLAGQSMPAPLWASDENINELMRLIDARLD